MADRIHMLERLSAVFDESQAQVLAEVIYSSYNDLVRREDFSELKEIVRDLGETQQRTEQRVEQLAEAQQRTERRVEQLAEAQQRTEQRVGQLAEAQQRTEQRVEQLAEAQQRTEQRVDELGEAQRRTETAVQSLAREVGGLSNRLGGDLEDVAAIVIEDALHRELGWQVEELSRVWQTRDGVDEEIDAFGKAYDPSRPDSTLWIVGEVKFNLTMRDLDRFSRLVERAGSHLEGEIVPVCFCYRIRPAVQKRVLESGYRLIMSSGRMPQGSNGFPPTPPY
ncbi:MAG: hypothetical protein OXF86_00970 [Caldilineaceae bacterium]|nr:hypothetical protein [Caldilineaceae bacterium]